VEAAVPETPKLEKAELRELDSAFENEINRSLWFDASAPKPPPDEGVDDVRRLTQKVAYYITPQKPPGSSDNQLVPPAVRFVWGSFQFDGMMDSLEENLEFFSSDGRPLRASMALSLSQQKITEFAFRPTGGAAAAPGGAGSPGTQPLTQASSGSTFQGLADAQGQGSNWQDAAARNGIENPRLLAPGQLVDLNGSAA
jgi:hypothetical protein